MFGMLGCAVVFSPGSRGQVALVIFEWKDAKYIGVDQSGSSAVNQWDEDVSLSCGGVVPWLGFALTVD